MHEIKKETRPVGDKKFTQQCAEKLITYLATHQYEHSVSMKQVMRPTNRDFHNMVQFLFRRLDVNYSADSAQMSQMTKEVPLMFKGISYPFAISKTALSAVGTPHTWPRCSRRLRLVELLMYDDAVEDHVFDDGGERAENRRFIQYLGATYAAFLKGDDDLCEQLKEEMCRERAEANEQILRDVDGEEAAGRARGEGPLARGGGRRGEDARPVAGVRATWKSSRRF